MATRRVISRDRTDSQCSTSSENKTPLPMDSNEKYSKYHVFAFWITFFSYALFHATRKTFSNVKMTVSETWTPQNTSLNDVFDKQWNGHQLFKDNDDASLFLGLLDTVFMISYSIGLFISGAIGDRINLKYVLAFGMCSSSLTVFMFGMVSEWLHLYSKAWYVVFWSLTGLLQSTGWPTVVAVIGNWFGKSSRGFVMGAWGACPCVGNIVGAYAVAGVLHYGYQYSFLITSSITFAAGLIVLFSLVSSPRDVGLLGPDESCDESYQDERPLLSDENDVIFLKRTISNRPKAIGICTACALPGVLPYSLAYACLKLVNYSFFFWLPYYLQHAYTWPESLADKLSIWYDVGGIIGGIVVGYLSDKLDARSPVVGFMLILSPGILFIYSDAPANQAANAALLTLTGTFIGGISSLISTAISADLGRQPELADCKEALSTVTGIIDGTGSAGAAIGQMLVPLIMQKYGWKSVFYLFIAMTIMTFVCISKIVVKDTVQLFKKGFFKKSSQYQHIQDNIINAEKESIHDSSN